MKNQISEQFSELLERITHLISDLEELKKEKNDTRPNETHKNKGIIDSVRDLSVTVAHVQRAQKSYNGQINRVFAINESNLHVIGKDLLLKYIKEQYKIAREFPWEIQIIDWKPGAIIKINQEWRFLEFETNPRNIEKKLKKAAELPHKIDKFTYKGGFAFMRRDAEELKKQIKSSKKPYIYIGFLSKPKSSIQINIGYLLEEFQAC
ncbi:MAG: hypothetical protein ACTSRS_21160 [Candidatus Helarchaeota archaeon]